VALDWGDGEEPQDVQMVALELVVLQWLGLQYWLVVRQ
jgi:hypothetical protein